MKVRYVIPYIHRLFTLVLMWTMVSLATPVLAEKVLVSLHNTRNPMPANSLAYLDQPGRFIIMTLNNTTDVMQEGHFDMRLRGPLQTSQEGMITVHPDRSNGSIYANVAIQPNGTTVVSGQNLNQLFMRCSVNDVYSSGALGEALTSARRNSNMLMPEGHYELTLTMIDDSGEELGSGSCDFDVCYTATAPNFINHDTFLQELYQKDTTAMTAVERKNRAILDTINTHNEILSDYEFFQLPVNMPYRFEWQRPELNLTSHANVNTLFSYDFELIEVPRLSSFENALQMGAVLFRQKNLTTTFVDLPYLVHAELKERVKTLGRPYAMLARVKANPINNGQDIYADDLIVQNHGYSQLAIVIVANYATIADAEEKKEAEGGDTPSVEVKILPIKNGLPVKPTTFISNPGDYITLEIKSNNKDDIEAVLLPSLKGDADWCLMPGAPAQAQHKDRTFTIDGKGYRDKAVTTTLTGAELTRVMGDYDWTDLQYYFEDTESFGGVASKRMEAYPEGEKSIKIQVFKADENAETIDEMDQMGEAEQTFEVKHGAGINRNLTVEIKAKPNVTLPDDAKRYLAEPEKYFDMTVTNSGDEAADVIVRLGLNQYGVSRDLNTVNLAGGSQKTFSTKEDWAPWRVTDTTDVKLRDEISVAGTGRDSTNQHTPTLPLKLREQQKKNAMRAVLYQQVVIPPDTTQNPHTPAVTKVVWCDTDSCLFVPNDLIGKRVKLTVTPKAGVEFPQDPMAYLQNPAHYFTMKVKRLDEEDDPELKKFAVQMLFPHPTEEDKWLTAVVKNRECTVPNGKNEYTFEDEQLNTVAGKHTTSELRMTDTLKYWTQKPVNLKPGETEVWFRLCHVDKEGNIVKDGYTSLKIDVKDQTQVVSVKLEKRTTGGSEMKALSVDEYLRHPEKYFTVKAKRLEDKDLTLGMMLTIDNKWTSIYPLTQVSFNMLKLTTNDEKTLTPEEVNQYLAAYRDFYIYTAENRMAWDASKLTQATDSLSMGDHKVTLSLYRMPRVRTWSANTPHLVDSVRTLAIATDSLTFSLKESSSVGVIVKVKNPKKAVTDHLDRIYKDPSEYFGVTLYNKLATEQTVRLAMVIDSTYTSVEPLLQTDAIKLSARPAKPGLVRKDSIELSSEQVNILLKAVQKEHFRKWTDYAANKWEPIEKPDEVRLSSSHNDSIHLLRVMAYLYTPGQDDKDYGTTEGCQSMKDTLGMAEVRFSCKVDSTVAKSVCSELIPVITDRDVAKFGQSLGSGQTLNVKDTKPNGSRGTWSLKVAGYKVTLKEVELNDKYQLKGNGVLEWTTKSGTIEIACEFDGIKVNESGECVEGEVTSTKANKSQASTYAEAIPYDWFEESALAGSRSEYIKRMKEAQGADNKMSEYYRYTKSGLMPVLGQRSLGNHGTILPAAVPVDMICDSKGGAAALAISPIDVALLNVSLGPDHAWMNLVGTLTLPEINTNQSKNIIMFGAPHLCMQQGEHVSFLPSEGAMAMMTDYELQIPSTDVTLSLIAPADWSDVMGGCYYGWKDGKFDVVTVKAGVTIPGLKAVDEKYERTGENARAEVAFTFRDKENWGFGLSLDAFQVEDLEDFTFTPTGGEVGIYYDNSSIETPKGVAFPDTYDFSKVGFAENVGQTGKASKENTGPWKGLYIQQVEVRLPDYASKTDSTAQEGSHGLTFGVKDVMIDKSGVTIKGYAADLGRYEMEGWKISLDTVAVDVVQSDFKDFHLNGSFRAPIFNADLGFRAGIAQYTHPQTKKKGAQIDFKIQQKDSMTFDIGIADLNFKKNNSYFQFGYNTVTKKAAAEIILGGSLSFKSPNPKVRVNMKDIKFAGMRLATYPKTQSTMLQSLVAQDEGAKLSKGAETEKKIPFKDKDLYYDIGRISLASPQKALGPFTASLEDLNLVVDSSKPETRIGAKLGVSISICDVFSVGGGCTIWGKLPEGGRLTMDRVTFDKLDVNARAGTMYFSGQVAAGEDGDIMNGFTAQLNIGTPVCNVIVEGGFGEQKKTEDELAIDNSRGIVYPDSTYAWGFFALKFDSDALAKLQPFSFKGAQGGGYFNCDTDKNPHYRTFGIMLGGQCTIGSDAGVQGDFKASLVYDLAHRRCSNFLFDINAKTLGGTVDVNAQLVYANPNDTTDYIDLLVTVDTENDADALASKLLGTDVKGLTETLNKTNAALADSTSIKGQASTGSTAWAAFSSFYKKDTLRAQASRTELNQALGQTNNYGQGEGPSGRDVRDSTQLVKVQAHVPINLHINLAAKPTKWHIYLGEPDYSKRCEVTFIDFAAGGQVVGMSSKVYANAYLCVGNELPNNGALPDLPADIQKALFDENPGSSVGGYLWTEQQADSTISQKHDLWMKRADMARQFGVDKFGAMIGMELGGKVSVNAALFYVDVNAHGAFDVTMTKLGPDALCSNVEGKAGGAGGFYAQGQLFALLEGEVGAIVNLLHVKGRVPVLKAGIPAIMQFGGPNPSWFYGTMRLQVSLLGGLVKFNVTSTTKAGSVCIPDYGNPLDEIKIFESVSPGTTDQTAGWSAKRKPESPYVVPTFSTVMPMGHSYTLVDQNTAELKASKNDTTADSLYNGSSLREYRFMLDQNKANDFALYLAQYHTDSVTYRAVTVRTEDNTHFTVDCGGALAQGQRYALNLKAHAEEYCFRHGSSVKSWGTPFAKDELSGNKTVEREWSQEVTYYFRTDSFSVSTLPEEVIAVARPGNANTLYKNNKVYRDEARRPYLSLTTKEPWERLCLDHTVIYGKLSYAKSDAAYSRCDSLEMELVTVDDDIYLVRPKGMFSIGKEDWDSQFTFVIQRVNTLSRQVDTLYACPFTVYGYDNFAAEVKALSNPAVTRKVSDFPSLQGKGLASLLNLSQRWQRNGSQIDALNASLSDESVYHDRLYADGSNLPQHYMLANPYLYMAYWSNFGLIGSQRVNQSHPYCQVTIDNTFMELRLNTPEYRNTANYTGHLQDLPTLSGGQTAVSARDGLKPAMFNRIHEGRRWGYESGQAWPALHDTLTHMVSNDALLAEAMLSGLRPTMKKYYESRSLSSKQMATDFRDCGMAECIDDVSASTGGGRFSYYLYQSILPYALTTAYGLKLDDVRKLGYGTGRSDDGTAVSDDMAVVSHPEYMTSATNWSKFPLSAACNFGSNDANNNYTFNAQRYLQSLDKYSYRLYRIDGYHTRRGASGYTVTSAGLSSNAYDIDVDAASGSMSGQSANADPVQEIKNIYISDLIVSVHSDRATAQQALTDQGYNLLPYDLNAGTKGGKAVYIGYKETTDSCLALTSVMVRVEDRMRASAASYSYGGRTYERVNYLGNDYGNLNSGAGGKILYLYQTRDAIDDNKKLANLDVLLQDNAIDQDNREIVYGIHWDAKIHDFQASYNVNLNQGAGGKFIYLKLDYEQRAVIIAKAREMQVISDLMVVAAEDASTARDLLEVTGQTSRGEKKAYTLFADTNGAPIDFNKGAGGLYVYLGYRTSSSTYDAITGLAIYRGNSFPSGGFKLNGATYQPVAYMGRDQGNLNAGTKGPKLYLCYTRDGNTESGEALISLTAAIGNGNQHIGDYEDVPCWNGQNLLGGISLNEGAGSTHIFLKGDYKRYEADGDIPDQYTKATPQYPAQLALAAAGDVAAAQLQILKAGYTLVDADLNGANKGQRIFMGYSTTSSPTDAIKQIIVRHDGREDYQTKERDYDGCLYKKAVNISESVDNYGDLNAGTKADPLYLYYTTDLLESGEYVKNIQIEDLDHSVSGSNEYAPSFDSKQFNTDAANLDAGTKSDHHIYIRKELAKSDATTRPLMYITDIMVADGEREQAKDRLREAGYHVWNVNINEKDRDQHPIYIGYKATTEPTAECITGLMLYRSTHEMKEIGFMLNGKYYERATLHKDIRQRGTLKPEGMRTGAHYFLCVTRSNEADGKSRQVITNRAGIHTTKGSGPYVSMYNPDQDGSLADFDLKAGGYGNSSWIYAPTAKADVIAGAGMPPAPRIENNWAFWTEVGIANNSNADNAKKALTDNGFTVYKVDLNEGGKQRSYLGYKRSSATGGWHSYAIDDIALYRRKSEWAGKVQYIDGSFWYRATTCSGSGDLNEGRSGEHLYLIYKKTPVHQATQALVGMESQTNDYLANPNFANYILDSGRRPPIGDTNAGMGTPTYLKPIYRRYNPGEAPASADAEVKYISDIAVAIYKNADEAKQQLEKSGYTALEIDLDPSRNYVAYMGYKSTTNPNDAVTGLVFASTNDDLSYIRFKLDNKVYTRCPDFGGHGGDLRKDCASAPNYYLCYTKDSDGSAYPLTTQTLVINAEHNVFPDDAVREVNINGFPEVRDNRAIINNDDKAYILAFWDKTQKVGKRGSLYQKDANAHYIFDFATSSNSKSNTAWNDNNFKNFSTKNNNDYRKAENVNRGGNYVYIGCQTSSSDPKYINDVAIFKGDLSKKDWLLIGKSPWMRAKAMRGSGNLNDNKDPKIFLIYLQGSSTNALSYEGFHVIQDKCKQYDYRFVEWIDADGKRTPNADLNAGLGRDYHIYLRCEFDKK